MGISSAVRIVALLLALGACATGPTPSHAAPSRAAPHEPPDAGDGVALAPTSPAAATAAPDASPAPTAPALPPAPEPPTTTTAPLARDVDELSPPTRTDGGPGFLVLCNAGYVCAYDEVRKNPAWVSYTFSGAIAFTGHQRENHLRRLLPLRLARGRAARVLLVADPDVRCKPPTAETTRPLVPH